MPRTFFHTTAEATVKVVEAVFAAQTATVANVEAFCDLSNAQASAALGLAVDLKLLQEAGGTFTVLSPLSRFFSFPRDQQKAAVLRIALESYDVFHRFRDRLVATNNASDAATQTKAILDLDLHREDVKETLISLGTYSGAISSKGSGQYAVENAEITEKLEVLARGCADLAAAETWVRTRLGPTADVVSRNDVLLPLAGALVKATNGDSDDAAQEAGNAFESYLAELATRMSVSLAGASGIIQKVEKFRAGNKLPKKLIESAKYIGQVRNAAGHGVDTDINASWTIQTTTAFELICVICSLIRAFHERETGGIFLF
ncbi:MAG: hypothetical protein K8R36_21760 [Planctomycetales bacterium]|nr:hypothetical protein [Planctomycetales bacterium]